MFETLAEAIWNQWAVVMTAPGPFLAALIIGLLLGWAAAWVILKQRIDHYKERIEYFKERAADTKSNSVGDRSATRAQLQRFYVELGDMGGVLMFDPDNQFPKFEQESSATLRRMRDWIMHNMGEAAVARFLDMSGVTYNRRFSNASNEMHNRMMTHYERYRQNLLAMIESSSWDKQI